jgi:hypothetical protein
MTNLVSAMSRNWALPAHIWGSSRQSRLSVAALGSWLWIERIPLDDLACRSGAA